MQDERCSMCRRILIPGEIVQLTVDGGQLCPDCVLSSYVDAESRRREYDRG